MKYLLPVLLVGALALGYGCNKASAAIQWKKSSYADALAEASKKDTVVMIDFYTDWCGWCKKLDSDTYPDPAVAERAAKMVSLKIDAEKGEGPQLAQKYQVSGFPMILFLDKTGRVVHQVVGYLPPAEFAAEMDKALAAK